MRAPETTHLSVRIPAELRDELARRADHEANSISSVARRLLADAVRDHPATDARIGDGDARAFEGAARG